MPEMPEVETVRRSLAERIVGRSIEAVEVRLPRLIRQPDVKTFSWALQGAVISAVRRKGKYLLVDFADGAVLVVHLRMTGRLLHLADPTADRYGRILFRLDDGSWLVYADTRTLGTLDYFADGDVRRIPGLASLGPEPLSAEFSLAYFRGLLQGARGRIKAVLLDQRRIAGVGNIYADESLAIAGVRPERSAQDLTEAEARRLYDAVNKVIQDAVAHGGTTVRDYADGTGRTGNHQHHLLVYGRSGEPCRRCGEPIRRSVVAGRGTHFCPRCQA